MEQCAEVAQTNSGAELKLDMKVIWFVVVARDSCSSSLTNLLHQNLQIIVNWALQELQVLTIRATSMLARARTHTHARTHMHTHALTHMHTDMLEGVGL